MDNEQFIAKLTEHWVKDGENVCKLSDVFKVIDQQVAIKAGRQSGKTLLTAQYLQDTVLIDWLINVLHKRYTHGYKLKWECLKDIITAELNIDVGRKKIEQIIKEYPDLFRWDKRRTTGRNIIFLGTGNNSPN